jgi:hypothetical protein
MLFELRNDKVSASEEALSIPEFSDLASVMTKEEFQNAIDYIYFTYDKKSPYYDILLEERKIIVSGDRLKDKKLYKKLEAFKALKPAILKFNKLTTTPAERLLEGANQKIEEYLEFWKDTPINDKTHELVATTIKNANELIKLRSTLESQVLNEKRSKNVGGSEAKLFEDA